MAVSLNAEQKKAVEHNGSPLLVVAGPGSGKTRVIIERVIHLVGKGLKPSEILCLTFSEKAAEEMKQRLEKVMDSTEMDISTFHSFAKEVLEDNVLDSGIGLSSGVIKRSTQLVWGLKNIDSFGFKHLEIGNNAVEVIESIIDGISTFKDELISPEELDAYIDGKLRQELSDEEKDFVLKLSDLSKVFHRYQEFQRSKAVIDFDDMVVQAIELFRKKANVVSKYQKKYKHILVDEFQDSNFAQLELVKLIGKSGNVTVVGDDDQSIYRFQGAYLTNFQDFKTHFPNTTVVTLNQNYRSTKNIVKAASDLLSSVADRQQKTLFSENEEGDRVCIGACSNESAEVEFVVNRVKELVGKPIRRRDGTESPLTYKDFVILSRRKMEGKKFSKALKAYGIPSVYIGEANIFSAPVIRDLMAYLRIANSPTTAGIEITRLMKSHGLTEQNIARINHAAKRRAREDPTDMDFVYETLKECSELGITQRDEVKELAEQIDKIAKLENETTIGEFVYKVMMSVSDLYKRAVQNDDPQSRRNQLLLKEMYNIALEYESLNPRGTMDDFVKYLSLMGQFDLELSEGYENQDAVQVTTIHQSKGREFPVVFVVDVAANKLPLRYQAKEFYVPNDLSKGIKREADEKELYLQEERRLFYVAMTRAQNKLFITYARRYGHNVRETKPSKFLDEIDFANNPAVELLRFEGTLASESLEAEERIERIKHDIQEKAIRSINQMQIKTAAQRLIELAKVRHFELNGKVDGFDAQSALAVDNVDGNLDSELEGKTVPLVNKEEIHLSASAIKTYIDCPLKFKFSYILGVPQPAMPYFDLGTSVHAVAEHMTKMQLEGTAPSAELASELLKMEWNANSFQSETQETQAKEKAKAMLRTYLQWLSANPNSPVAAEAEFTIQIAGVPFHGFIDRVEQRPDGELEVVDFKTGAVYENAKSIREDPQMNIYALGVQKLFGKLPRKASLFYIQHDKTVPYDVVSSQVDKVREEIEVVVNAILKEKFGATPSFDACRKCAYWSICDSKENEDG
ncbi:MAG TPA: ATP-dependent DNA helicase [Nitrososphaera sp.]|nr:ATP-dependent DNA helicase [Nitrososphaera sp.]